MIFRPIFFAWLFLNISALSFAKDIDESKPVLKLIKAGAKIYSLDETEQFLLDETRYFYVTYDDPEKPTFVYLLSNDKKVIYKTAYKNLNDVDDVINIEPKFEAKNIYKKQTRFQSDDKDFQFNILPSISYESTDITSLSELYGSELSSANANRFSLSAVVPSSLGLDFGVAVNYQTLFWGNESEEVKLNSVNAGPFIQIPLKSWNNFKPVITLGAELSLSATGKSSLYEEDFSKTVWHLGLSDTFNSKIGPFVAEVFYRRQELILEKTTRSFNNTSKEFNLSSIGFSLGYRWDYQL